MLFLILGISPSIADELDSYKATCKEIGFKPKTTAFGDCVLELKRRSEPDAILENQKNNPITSSKSKSDGSADDKTCQKYGFKFEEESYKKCRLDLKIAADEASAKLAQYEIQKRAYEQQAREYDEQKRLYQAKLYEAESQKKREETWNLLTFGAALINGSSLGDSAYALRGQPVPPRQYYSISPPTQPSIPNFTLNTPIGNAYCSFNNITNQMNCR